MFGCLLHAEINVLDLEVKSRSTVQIDEKISQVRHIIYPHHHSRAHVEGPWQNRRDKNNLSDHVQKLHILHCVSKRDPDIIDCNF